MNTALKNNLMLLASAVALLGAPALRSQTFDVNLNTAALSAQDGANAPFYLDFQLNYGASPEAANTVTLSDFQFAGGSAVGAATTSGTAAGSLTSGVTLTASSSSQLNELFQQFASTTTDISFTATVSENGPNPGNGVTPTVFTTAILDSEQGFPAEITTTDPNDGLSSVALNLKSTDTPSSVNTYASIAESDGVTPLTGVTATITAIPEPSMTAAVFGCAAAMLAFYTRRSGKLRAV